MVRHTGCVEQGFYQQKAQEQRYVGYSGRSSQNKASLIAYDDGQYICYYVDVWYIVAAKLTAGGLRMSQMLANTIYRRYRPLISGTGSKKTPI